ncbi:STY0301 family protein [Achromobacter sp. MFA1 R4]|uniref:STY0301 family protein n=1 Tax=Achromobacter sp. MFA1 R4 TaxID=1881016 RepID=UPI0009537621|nr:STY0301 family protein [Achromobacter sp. MFA1 R4]SIT28227.1 hypothetical protein SAMN05428937_3847 [Achromobacter sp. MFA1 R4]
MSSNERSSRWIASAGFAAVTLLLSLSHSQTALADSRVFQCPAQIQVDGAQLSLSGLNVFEGPIENRVALVPETSSGAPGTMRWQVDAGATPYMKCRYQGSRHYLVMVAEDAKRCIAKAADGKRLFQASCS